MKQLLRVVAGLLVGTAVLAAQRASDYTVGPRDVLQITTLDEPSMTGRFPIDSDGSISFPYLNRVVVIGLTPTAIEARLKDELVRQQIFKPGKAQISVDVAEFRSRVVYILGAVRTPGEYRLAGDMSLIAALAQAGGLNAGASNEISIMRPKAGQPLGAVKPEQPQNAEITTVRISDLQSGVMTQNMPLKDGDTIWIPVADRFYISGQVKNAGGYVHERGLSVQQALALAGGITELGSDRRISIERMVGGRKRTIKAILTDLVQPNDTITVGRRRF
jgi:polysaccharide export outer membrane protein